MRSFDVAPIRGAWHIGSNSFSTRYVPGTNRLYERARLGCLPGGAGHGGRDIHNDTDDKTLRAVWDGTVHRYPWDDYGNHIGIINSDGQEAFYAHLASVHVKDGQAVKADTDLGILGSTGQASGPHLHFELRTAATQWCTAIDPTTYLQEAGMALTDEDKKWLIGTINASVANGVRAAVRALGWGDPQPGDPTIPDDPGWTTLVKANNILQVMKKP